jgi:hypothetical protein
MAFKQKRDMNMADEFRSLAKAQGIMKTDIEDNSKLFFTIAGDQDEKIKAFKLEFEQMKKYINNEIKKMKQNEMSEAKVNKLFDTYTKNMLEKYQQSAA